MRPWLCWRYTGSKNTAKFRSRKSEPTFGMFVVRNKTEIFVGSDSWRGLSTPIRMCYEVVFRKSHDRNKLRDRFSLSASVCHNDNKNPERKRRPELGQPHLFSECLSCFRRIGAGKFAIGTKIDLFGSKKNRRWFSTPRVFSVTGGRASYCRWIGRWLVAAVGHVNHALRARGRRWAARKSQVRRYGQETVLGVVLRDGECWMHSHQQWRTVCSATAPVETQLHSSTDCMGRWESDGKCCGREAQCGRRTKRKWTKTPNRTHWYTRVGLSLCGHRLRTGP